MNKSHAPEFNPGELVFCPWHNTAAYLIAETRWILIDNSPMIIVRQSDEWVYECLLDGNLVKINAYNLKSLKLG